MIAEDAPEVRQTRLLLGTLLGNRELLLAAVLAGKTAWRNQCIRLFAGLRFTDDMIDSMWHYIDARKGPNPVYEYERLQEQREQREAAARAEAAMLRELYELSHGKNREEESAKIARASAAPELTRLPEIVKA